MRCYRQIQYYSGGAGHGETESGRRLVFAAAQTKPLPFGRLKRRQPPLGPCVEQGHSFQAPCGMLCLPSIPPCSVPPLLLQLCRAVTYEGATGVTG